MHTKPPIERIMYIELRTSLELFRSDLVDLEALANAAKEALEQLPYIPKEPCGKGEDDPLSGPESALRTGRLCGLVCCTATAAEGALSTCSKLIDWAYENEPEGVDDAVLVDDIDDDDDDDDDGSNGANGGGGANGSGNGSNGSGNGSPPDGGVEGAAPSLDADELAQARPSRGGIALDLAQCATTTDRPVA
ncbi:hypothetical protein [Haliangium ochraceum]|uniref:Uncharacterized protein n=1 Tax=Haliangium ochraceum (strain DSM 14365 / JCM 11303 / SMP-2) TaxID=502025 RepID=D0LN27_HALO1|nr:hypothetical protein [Haliangium ochraceum]ACY13398.1 hypothetical protein Hoch_0782 [Haliangium ochraceum DSM 14365]